MSLFEALLHAEGVPRLPVRRTQGFPDISVDRFGVEVKTVQNDSWHTISNSIFEGTRLAGTDFVYVMFGKMGGEPRVRWAHYGDVVSHVRTTHMPRFEIDLDAEAPLFQRLGVPYDEFRGLSDDEKMRLVRSYWRTRLGPGEHLWWLEDVASQPSLPPQVRLWANLDREEKRRLTAEAVILNPQILDSGRSRTKYDDVATYFITVHGVLCRQVRDLFSAGSAAGVVRPGDERGGLYLQRFLEGAQDDLLDALDRIDDSVLKEYWDRVVPRDQRLKEWLRRADSYALPKWKPSDVLFVRRRGSG